MQKCISYALFFLSILLLHLNIHAQSNSDLSVEVVATATEYTLAAPQQSAKSAQSHTDCSGQTSFLGSFADSHISCTTTSKERASPYAPKVGGLLTSRPQIRYTVVKSDQALYLLSCTQNWRWSKCPAFPIGAKYTLKIKNGSSDVQLQDPTASKPITIQYVSAVALPTANSQPDQRKAAEPASTPEQGKTLSATKLRGVLDSVVLVEAFTNANGVVFVTMESASDSPETKKSTYTLSCDREAENCRIPRKGIVYTMFDYATVQYKCQNAGLYQGAPSEVQSGAGDFYGIYCIDGVK